MFKIFVQILIVLVLAAPCAADLSFEFNTTTPGVFIDISGTGTQINLGDDGVTNRNSTFLGRSVRISNNGALALASSGNVTWQNRNLPTTNAFNGSEAFMPFWDDLDSESGAVYYQDLGDRFIVQWDDRNHYRGTGVFEGITFQAQIFKSSGDAVQGDVVAQFVYADTEFALSQAQWNNGSSATIGWQSGTGDSALYSFNTPSVTAGTVVTLSAVPEPSTFMTFAIASLLILRRRRRSI